MDENWTVSVKIWNDGSVRVSRVRVVDGKMKREILQNDSTWSNDTSAKINRVLREDAHSAEYEF
jgi:hypothetical protein